MRKQSERERETQCFTKPLSPSSLTKPLSPSSLTKPLYPSSLTKPLYPSSLTMPPGTRKGRVADGSVYRSRRKAVNSKARVMHAMKVDTSMSTWGGGVHSKG
jgi:hypothetical protein